MRCVFFLYLWWFWRIDVTLNTRRIRRCLSGMTMEWDAPFDLYERTIYMNNWEVPVWHGNGTGSAFFICMVVLKYWGHTKHTRIIRRCLSGMAFWFIWVCILQIFVFFLYNCYRPSRILGKKGHDNEDKQEEILDKLNKLLNNTMIFSYEAEVSKYGFKETRFESLISLNSFEIVTE